ADQRGRPFDLRAVGELLGLAIALGVVSAAARDAQAGGRQQQPADETVAGPLGVLLGLAVALLGSLAVVGSAEGVLGLLALLADVGLVEEEGPGAGATRLLTQQQVGDGSQHGPVLRPVAAGQETRQLGAVACLERIAAAAWEAERRPRWQTKAATRRTSKAVVALVKPAGRRKVLMRGKASAKITEGLLPRQRTGLANCHSTG